MRTLRVCLLLIMAFGTASPARAQLYPVFNFRWHDSYAFYDPSTPLLHVIGLGMFPELEYVYPPAGSLWFLQSNGPTTCTGTCTDPRFTGCTASGMNAGTWPPFVLGTPVQDSGGGVSGAYLRLRSSRTFTFAGTQTFCGHAGGQAGQKDEVCDPASGMTDAGNPYFLQSPLGELRSKVIFYDNSQQPAEFVVWQTGTFANYQLSPFPAFWITGTGSAVTSSLSLRAFTDGTARWYGNWTIVYWTLGCSLNFPLQAIAVGQP